MGAHTNALNIILALPVFVAILFMRCTEPVEVRHALSGSTDAVQYSAFMSKVYAMLLLQLVTTAVAAVLFVAVVVPQRSSVFGFEGNTFRHKLVGAVTSSLAQRAMIALSFTSLCMLLSWRKDPWISLQLFEVFAVVQRLISDPVNKRIVIYAAALACLIFSALTALACNLTADIGFLRPFLAQALAVLIWSRIASLVFGYRRRMMFPASAGAMLFAAYIIFDTKQIISHYAHTEYISAAAQLYFHLLNLFFELLKALSKKPGFTNSKLR